MEALNLLIFSSFFTGLLIISLLIIANKTHNFALRWLCISLFALSYSLFVEFLIHSRRILDFTYLFQTSVPLMYIFFPALYFYVRSVLFREHRLKRSDWVHFIPAIISFIDLLPFYLSNIYRKKTLLQETFIEGGSVFDLRVSLVQVEWHQFMKPTIAILYILLIVIQLFNHYMLHHTHISRATHHWLISLCGLYLVFLVHWAAFYMYDFTQFGLNPDYFKPTLALITFLSIGTMILRRPDVLYGIDYDLPEVVEGLKVLKDEHEEEEYIPKIITSMESEVGQLRKRG